MDLAIAELEKGLANSPGSPRDMARWLNLKADYFVQYGDDSVEASSCLQRIIAQHPGTAFAIAAEQRLARLGSERKKHDTRPTIKLGAYRNNLGLPDEMD